jgi:hypothetical protein
MFFVKKLVIAPSQMLGAAVGELPGFSSTGSVTVAEDVANSVPGNWVLQTASDEISVSAPKYFAAPADPRSAQRYVTLCGLRRGFDHIADPRLPRSSLRVRCEGPANSTEDRE